MRGKCGETKWKIIVCHHSTVLLLNDAYWCGNIKHGDWGPLAAIRPNLRAQMCVSCPQESALWELKVWNLFEQARSSKDYYYSRMAKISRKLTLWISRCITRMKYKKRSHEVCSDDELRCFEFPALIGVFRSKLKGRSSFFKGHFSWFATNALSVTIPRNKFPHLTYTFSDNRWASLSLPRS